MPRLWALDYRDIEPLSAVSGTTTLFFAATATTDPVFLIPVIATANRVNQLVTLLIAADAYWDFKEFSSPMPSDVAQYTLNMANLVLAGTAGWRVGFFTTIFGVLDQGGVFDGFYERFNK